MNSEVLPRIRQAYSLIQSNRSPEGFPRDITRSGKVAAILAAHAAYPATHENAQGYGQLLVNDLGINTVLKNFNPCIVLGIRAAYKYIVLQGRIDKIFGPFRPACIVHGEHYERCHRGCEYGVKLEDKWVHEILDAQPLPESTAPRLRQTPAKPRIAVTDSVPRTQVRQQFLKTFLYAYECPFLNQCKGDDPNIGRLDDRIGRVRSPQPGFIGADYHNERILLVGNYPGVDKSGRFNQIDLEMYENFDRLSQKPSDKEFNGSMQFLGEMMMDWPIIVNQLRPKEMGIRFPDSIAYLNLVKCASWENDYEDKKPHKNVYPRCVKEHLINQIDILEPRVVLCLGKAAYDYLLLKKDSMPQLTKRVYYLDRNRNRKKSDPHNRELRATLKAYLQQLRSPKGHDSNTEI